MRNIFLSLILSLTFAIHAQNLTIHDDFPSLLGKHLKGWQYADSDRDFEQLDLYMDVYQKNKSLQFQPKDELRIPKVIHFIWLGPKNFPRNSIANIRSWVAHHPDWRFYFWTDRDRIAPVEGLEVRYVKDFSFRRLKDLYLESNNWGEKSDLLRLEILSQQGGLYADHDMVCVRPYDNLHSVYDFFACVGTPHPRVSGYCITACNGHFGAKPGHPILERSMDLILERKDEIKWLFPTDSPYDTEQRIINSTYISFTMAIQDMLSKDDNIDIIFPASYFLGLEGLPNFYSMHQYTGLWRKPLSSESVFQIEARHKMTSIEKGQRRLLMMELGLFMLIFFAFVLVIIKQKRVY